MAKKRIGGRATLFTRMPAGGIINQAQNAQNAQQAQQPVQNAATPSGGIGAFSKLSEQQQAQAILSAINSPALRDPTTNTLMPNNTFQKLSIMQGFDNAPQMVDSATFDKASGEAIYRVVNASSTDTYKAQSMADSFVASMMLDRNTAFSDSGGSAYGRGLYFCNDLRSDISWYANGTASSLIRAKYSANANVIKYSNVVSGVNAEIAKGSALGNALRQIGTSADRASCYAAAKGYNVIDNGSGYRNVLSREAIMMDWDYKALSKKTKASPPSKWSDL